MISHLRNCVAIMFKCMQSLLNRSIFVCFVRSGIIFEPQYKIWFFCSDYASATWSSIRHAMQRQVPCPECGDRRRFWRGWNLSRAGDCFWSVVDSLMNAKIDKSLCLIYLKILHNFIFCIYHHPNLFFYIPTFQNLIEAHFIEFSFLCS